MLYLTIIGASFIAWLVLAMLFTPAIPYHVEARVDPEGDHFIHVLESTCHTTLEHDNKVEIFTNGTEFYPAMLNAIHRARETINLEGYIFKDGEIATRFVDALSERARAGVRVSIVLDAIGSFGIVRHFRRKLVEAGCRVEAYRGMLWYSLARLNNRTHRELLVIDGQIAFVGGAGIADWWWKPHKGKPMWRDMMARIEGPVVSDIQGVVAENWLECCGEILTGIETYKPHVAAGTSPAFAIKSSPADRATASRVLFQTIVEEATRTVHVATPYFLPDRAFREAFRRAASRGVEILVVVPGPGTDQHWVRLASRRMYGDLLEIGIRIFEYTPGMTHVKMLVADQLWSIIGTTNLDNRSFEHNDEVNVVVRDPEVAGRLLRDFRCDMEQAAEVTLAMWRRRPLWEKLIGTVAWILERQQ